MKCEYGDAGTVGWEPRTGLISVEKPREFALADAGFVAAFCIRASEGGPHQTILSVPR